MKISFDRPPLWDKIAATFDVVGKPIIFAWGDTIYNPERVPLTKELHAHEEIHGSRQALYLGKIDPEAGIEKSVATWWERYLVDAGFRLDEEIPAHHAEYLAYCKRHFGGSARRRALDVIAGKLASPLYGGLITVGAALHAVLVGKRETAEAV